jgi:hypothetical protein
MEVKCSRSVCEQRRNSLKEGNEETGDFEALGEDF